MIKWFLLACLFLVGAAGAFGMWSTKKQRDVLRTERTKFQNEFKLYLPRILQDYQLLTSQSPFKLSPRKSNAESLISKHVSWQGPEIQPNAQSQKWYDVFNSKYKNWSQDPSLVTSALADADLSSADVGWIADLVSTDHLDLTKSTYHHSRLSQLSSQDSLSRFGTLTSLPLLHYGEFRTQTLLYAFQAAKAGDPLKALQTLRKSAELCQSAHDLIGEQMSVQFLKDEAALMQQFPVEGWQLVEPETIEAFQRFSFSSPQFTLAAVLQIIPKAIRENIDPRTGICAGAIEITGTAADFADLLGPQYPLELNFKGEIDAANKWRQDLFKACGLDGFMSVLSPSKAKGWPFVRQTSAMQLISVATPNWIRRYESTEKSN